MFMKIFNYFFILTFIVFAALQYNDPDPYVWVPIYLYAAFLCAIAIRNQYPFKAYWVGFVVYGVYAIYKFFDQDGVLDWIKFHHATNIAETMKAEKPWVEETREFFGLVIVMVVLLLNYLVGKNRRTTAK